MADRFETSIGLSVYNDGLHKVHPLPATFLQQNQFCNVPLIFFFCLHLVGLQGILSKITFLNIYVIIYFFYKIGWPNYTI